MSLEAAEIARDVTCTLINLHHTKFLLFGSEMLEHHTTEPAYTPAQKFYWSCRREDKAQSEDKFLNSENFLKNHES